MKDVEIRPNTPSISFEDVNNQMVDDLEKEIQKIEESLN